MTRVESRARRLVLRRRLADGAVRRRVERAVYAELGVRPAWWLGCR
jgi:hypothetical protein